jgi:iron complex transport system ATP-binding protein
MAILELQNLTAGYDENEVLHNLSFSIQEGQFVGIAGPNGAGKSTLLRLLAGLLKPTNGTVSLLGQPIERYSQRHLAQLIAVIFQDFLCPYEFSVFDLVTMGRSPFLSRWKSLSTHDRAIIGDVMEMTNISHLCNRLFPQLSGGEKQRVLIAKALAQKPYILLLDEPAIHLDIHHQVNIFNILHRLNQERHVTIICITHDLTLAAQYVDRFLLLGNGHIVKDGFPKEILKKESLENLFHTPLSVGTMAETNIFYVYPLRY